MAERPTFSPSATVRRGSRGASIAPQLVELAKLSYLQSAIYTWLVDPGFLGKPVVIGLAD
jgi:hypothetical protein